MGIAVYDQAPDAETLLMSGNQPVASSDDDAEEEAEAALSTVERRTWSRTASMSDPPEYRNG